MSTPTYDSPAEITTLQASVRKLNAVLHQFNNSEGALSAKDEATLAALIDLGQTIATEAEVLHAFAAPAPVERSSDPRHGEAAWRQAHGIDAHRPLSADERAAFEGDRPLTPAEISTQAEAKQPVAPFPFGHTEAQFRTARGIGATRPLTPTEKAQYEAQRKNPAPKPVAVE